MTTFNTLNPTDIYDFPKHWKKNKFYNLFSVVKDISKNVDNEVVLSLTQKGIVIKDIESNKGQIASNYEKYTKVKLNDIVFNPMDLISGWVDIVKESGVISPSYLSFRPNENKVNPFFALFLFQTLYVNKMLFNFGKGVATHDGFGRWSISDDIIKKTNIFLPDINTQNKIVNYLEQKTKIIDTLTEKLQKKIELLKEQRTSLINHCVTKGLDPNVEKKDSNVDWIGDIPKHWIISKFKFVSTLYTGNSLNENQKLQYQSKNLNDIPYIASKDIDLDRQTINYNNGLRIPIKNNQFKIAPIGSFLMVVEGGSAGRKLAFLEEEVCFVNKLCAFYSTENTKFQYYFVQSQNYQNKFKSTISGLIGGVSISNLKNFELPLPPLLEQEEIVKYLEDKTRLIDQKVFFEEKRIELLKEYRQSLISSVVTGKVHITKEML